MLYLSCCSPCAMFRGRCRGGYGGTGVCLLCAAKRKETSTPSYCARDGDVSRRVQRDFLAYNVRGLNVTFSPEDREGHGAGRPGVRYNISPAADRHVSPSSKRLKHALEGVDPRRLTFGNDDSDDDDDVPFIRPSVFQVEAHQGRGRGSRRGGQSRRGRGNHVNRNPPQSQ